MAAELNEPSGEQNVSESTELQKQPAPAPSPWMTIRTAPPSGGAGSSDDYLARVQALASARQGKLVVNPDITPVAIEQYRRLAAVMHQAQLNRGVRTAMIASALPSEGKSLTAANLALTLSESYRRRVLLIDADLRRPTLHDTFQIPNLAGVSDWLKNESAGPMPLVEITPNLSIVPGGRPDPDPMSGLVSSRMKHVLNDARERFDWIIMDTPPIAVLPDGHLLASMVDTVVLVIGAGSTPLATIQQTVAELGRDRIIGVVMNRGDVSSLSNYNDSYYLRYRKAVGSGTSLREARG